MKILIVDDSAVYRAKIRSALLGLPNIEVVGSAPNGKSALEMLDQQPVDLMTLDLEMPVMGGMETLRKLKERKVRPKVIVLSSSTRSGSELTMEALNSGANDFMAKPNLTATDSSPEKAIQAELLPKIRQFLLTTPSRTSSATKWPAKHLETFIPHIVVIASSTGGPAAHDAIFREFRGTLRVPVLIAQHMPPIFTTALAKRINGYNGIPCAEAVHGERLDNKIYVAPGDFHMTVAQVNGVSVVHLDKQPSRNSVRPAADYLFESAAALFGPKCMGFVLTGMGEDGLDGCKAIKKKEGGVMIQDEASCVVFGMPGAIHSAGCYDGIGNPALIQKQLARMVLK